MGEKKKVEIHLNNGLKVNAELTGFNGSDFTKDLNNPNLTHINVGDVVINKHAILLMLPISETTLE